MKVIIVDDEPMVLEDTKEVVQMAKPEAELICVDNYIDALNFANENTIDVAFLDIEMPSINGLELAKRLKDINGDINIIFATAYSQYAIDAFDMYASGYLVKPIQREDVEKAFLNLRKPVQYEETKLRIQCFGKFEVYYKGQPVRFKRSRSKEILAYLVNLKGATANTAELCAVLWEDSMKETANKHYFRNLIQELKRVMKECQAEDVFICRRNQFAIDVSKVDCDLYKFMEKDVTAINSYHGEYMNQYSWAEFSIGMLRKFEDS